MIYKPTLQELSQYADVITLQSNLGTAAKDIFVDMLPTGDDQYFVIHHISQQQDGGVGKNVGAFLCNPGQSNQSDPTDPTTGLLLPQNIGTNMGFDGSVAPNIGDIQTFNGFPFLVPPRGWFVRFATFAPAGFPGVGSQFQVWITFSRHNLECEC